jgi:hypothetical protein
MLRRLQMALVPLALIAAAGCTPNIRVNVLKPAPVNLGSAKAISVVETTGRRSAREHVVAEMIKQARSDGFFTVADRSEEGISVKVSGRTVTASGGKGSGQRADEIGMKIDILDWSANSETVPEQRDDKGNVTSKEHKVWKGKVLLGVTAFNSQGQAYLAETEFEGQPVEAETEEGAIKAAANWAVQKVLRTVTPRYEQQYIRLDGDDEGQKQIIEVAKAGNLDRASTELKSYLDGNPKNPAALYNMAVLLDAQGKYQEALDLYTQAIQQSTKDFYVDMKTKCAQRLADQQAMMQQ